MEFHMYRVKFIKSAQFHLFHPDLTPQEMMKQAMAERPSVKIKKGHVWHLGNVEYITNSAGRFAVGRTTKTTVEKFDADTGNFVEHIDDSGPYTFTYFDTNLGLLGICKKAKVAADVKAIARKLQILFSDTIIARRHTVEVRVTHIPDPQDFIQKLHSAYSIKKFKAAFTGPNPIDADELFQKPMAYYCQQLEGEVGNVVVIGSSLNEAAVVAVAKSTAATANTASALIQTKRGSRPVSISLKGDASKVFIEEDTNKTEVLEAIQEAYREIRE